MIDELETKGFAAAKKYLELKGYKIIDCNTSEGIDIVAKDLNEMTLAFINVMTYDGTPENLIEFPKERTLSKKELHALETKAYRYFKRATDSESSNIAVRFDDLTIVKVGDDRALIRHYTNITG